MHSLPSRRRLPQPNFFRSKCYRLSPVPVSLPPPKPPSKPPPPPPPLPAASLPRLLPVPPDMPLPFPATLTRHTLTPGAIGRQQAGRPPSAQTGPHTPGTARQADRRRLHVAVGRQGCRTFPQSAIRDSVIHVLPQICENRRLTHSRFLVFPQKRLSSEAGSSQVRRSARRKSSLNSHVFLRRCFILIGWHVSPLWLRFGSFSSKSEGSGP